MNILHGLPPGYIFSRRPFQPHHTERLKARGWNGNGSAKQFHSGDFEKVLAAVASGIPIPAALTTSGLPSLTWFRRWLRENHEAKARLLSVIDASSFPVQARVGYGMGPRFTDAVKALRASGMSDKRIGEHLGVTAMTVHARRKKSGIK